VWDQRAYYDGLNDHLRELLSRAVQKEIITRPQHLALFLSLNLRPQKMELVLQDNCILCHTDSEVLSKNGRKADARPTARGSSIFARAAIQTRSS
jgi:hypothetical protein